MKKTINQLRVEFQDIATAHDQINYFFWGDVVRSWNEDEVSYPRMCAYYPSGQMLTNQTEIQFVIDIADKLYEDIGINLNDIESDTLQICRDIFQVINQSARWQKLGRVESCSVTKFIETTADSIAGHSMTFTFRLRDNSGICNLPMTDYDFDEVVNAGCAGVTYEITDSDDNILYSGSVDSGGSLNQGISDSTAVLKDTAGNVLSSSSILAQGSLDIEAPDATFANSDNSYTGSILSGGSLNIPDSQINVNGVDEGDVVSVKTIDVNITDGVSPVTPDAVSLVGNTLTVQVPASGLTDDYSPVLVDFYTISFNNPFGTTERFTDELGGQTYTNRIMIDWLSWKVVSGTVQGVYMDFLANADWTTQVANCAAVSIGSFTTGWSLWTQDDCHRLCIVDNTSTFYNYTPLLISGFGGYCHTITDRDATFTYKVIAQFGSFSMNLDPKASVAKGMAVRDFTITGTTLG